MIKTVLLMVLCSGLAGNKCKVIGTDKIVFDDLKSNVIMAAIMTYMASEDPETTSKVKSVLPISPRTGEPMTWPTPRSPNRRGGLD